MRLITILLLLFVLTNAQEKKQKVTLGAGPYIQTQPYKECSDILVPSPVVFFDNSLFYVRWSRLGVYFLGDKQENFAWGFSLTMQPRPYGYKASDSPYLKGMQTRKNTLEGGVAFSASYDDAFFEIMALTDVLDRYDSWLLKAEIGKEFSFGDFSLYPSLILTYLSKDFVDYYYGVQASEKDLSINRTLYQADAGLQVGAQTFFNYNLNKEYALLLNIRADRLTNDARNSPLTDDDYIYSGLLSLMYTFEY